MAGENDLTAVSSGSWFGENRLKMLSGFCFISIIWLCTTDQCSSPLPEGLYRDLTEAGYLRSPLFFVPAALGLGWAPRIGIVLRSYAHFRRKDSFDNPDVRIQVCFLALLCSRFSTAGSLYSGHSPNFHFGDSRIPLRPPKCLKSGQQPLWRKRSSDQHECQQM